MFTEIVLQIALVQLSLMVSYCKSLRKEGEFVLGSKEALKSFATTKIASGLQLPALPSLWGWLTMGRACLSARSYAPDYSMVGVCVGGTNGPTKVRSPHPHPWARAVGYAALSGHVPGGPEGEALGVGGVAEEADTARRTGRVPAGHPERGPWVISFHLSPFF